MLQTISTGWLAIWSALRTWRDWSIPPRSFFSMPACLPTREAQPDGFRSCRYAISMRISNAPKRSNQTLAFLNSSFSIRRTVTASDSVLHWRGKMPGWSATSSLRRCGENSTGFTSSCNPPRQRMSGHSHHRTSVTALSDSRCSSRVW